MVSRMEKLVLDTGNGSFAGARISKYNDEDGGRLPSGDERSGERSGVVQAVG